MFIDDHRVHFDVEAICKGLPIAPSPYSDHESIERDAFIMARITHF